MRRNVFGWALVTLLSVVAFVGCGSAPEEGAVAAIETEMRKAPDFTLPVIGGGEMSLAETAGKVRLVDFWATWCAPCREEIPFLNELQETYGEQGFDVIAISSESPEEIESFMQDHPSVYTNLVGTEALEQEYQVLGMPTGYLVDRDGNIVDVYLGAKPTKVLRGKIEELLAAS